MPPAPFQFHLRVDRGPYPHANVYAAHPGDVLGGDAVRACDLYTDDSGETSLAQAVDTHGTTLPSSTLRPAADGVCLHTQSTPACLKRGVQMRVLRPGPYCGAVVRVCPRQGFKQRTYTLWLPHPAGGKPDIVTLDRDEIAPLHSPFPCQGFPPTCVQVPLQGAKGRQHTACGIVAPPPETNPETESALESETESETQSETQSETGSAYDPITGTVSVDVDPRTQEVLQATNGFAQLEGQRAEVLRAMVDRDHPTKTRRVMLCVKWYALNILAPNYVPWGHTVRLCGIPREHAHHRHNGALCVVNRVDYALPPRNPPSMVGEYLLLDGADGADGAAGIELEEKYAAPALPFRTLGDAVAVVRSKSLTIARVVVFTSIRGAAQMEAAQRAANKVYQAHHHARDVATQKKAHAAAEHAAETMDVAGLVYTEGKLDARKVARRVTLLGNETDVFWAQVQSTLARKYKGGGHEVALLVRGLRGLAEHEWRQWHRHREAARRSAGRAEGADEYLQAAADANTPPTRRKTRQGKHKKHKKHKKKKKKKRR